MMLAQVEQGTRSRDLGVEREVVAEAMLSIELEAEKGQVEFLRLVDVENAQDGDDPLQLDGRLAQSAASASAFSTS